MNRMNVIVLCVDCLRQDHLSALTAPHLFDLCRGRGVGAANAYAAAPWTYPSSHSLLTGFYPHRHGACHQDAYRYRVSEPPPGTFDDRIPTLFSLLEGVGYSTIGISTNYWALNEHCRYLGCKRIVRSQKFEKFCGTASAKWVVDTFIDEISQSSQSVPFFAYLHFMDLHRPFDLDAAIQYADAGTEILEGIDDWDPRLSFYDTDESIARFRSNKIKLYDGLIRYFDAQLQRLVRFLVGREAFHNTILVVTSDHGEEFWEHEQFESQQYDCGRKSVERWLLGTGHGHTLFNELLHVPLIFVNAPQPLNRAIRSTPVSIVDVMPTLLTFLGMNQCHAMDGESLTQEISGREILAESILYGYERKTILKGNIKVISAPGDGHLAVYDLARDPEEKHGTADGIDPVLLEHLEKLHEQLPPRETSLRRIHA